MTSTRRLVESTWGNNLFVGLGIPVAAGGGVSSIDADEMLAVREIDITCEVVEGSAATATLRVVGDILGISSITGGIMTVAGGTKVPTPAPSGGPAGGGVSPAP